ncbi:glycosyltransferase family 4 protein [Nakamurella alba]|uniref:glycosyltransferase family 4 protein n=1 Tax=Nakamurella alba TaxID=2665158 RepID=UPI0018AA5183|nr:glycosyltransferase family 4 protein [Nakamurella alba]
MTFREGRGVPGWVERNKQSPVPGLWPYGLDLLSGAGLPVKSVEVPDLSGLGRRLAGAIGARRPRGGAGTTALAWDETSAVPMYSGIPAYHHFSGVIWATDAVAAGERSAALDLAARTLPRFDGLWVLSRPQAEKVQQWLGAGSPPVHFLRFGVDADFYAAAPYPDEPHVVSVGGDRDRDPATLFEALRLVLAARPGTRVTVQSGTDLPVPDGVTVVPRLPHVEVRDLLASATVTAIATRHNLHASGMTVGLESLSTGRPVVACATPGMDDYFGEDRARLVPPADPAAMADEILGLLGDPAGAAAMGEAGAAVVRERYTTGTMCADLASILTGR